MNDDFVRISTLGFTKTSARQFFETIASSGATRLIDVRLNNVSQLAGFSKRADLEYFLRALNGVSYDHDLRLAPTKSMLDSYKKRELTWEQYKEAFLTLMEERRIDLLLSRNDMNHTVLLCSEATPHHCHRRLIAEYLAERWGSVVIEHL